MICSCGGLCTGQDRRRRDFIPGAHSPDKPLPCQTLQSQVSHRGFQHAIEITPNQDIESRNQKTVRRTSNLEDMLQALRGSTMRRE
jgi:hypothetical protein